MTTVPVEATVDAKSLPDEDTLVIPATLAAEILPRRGGVPGPPVVLDGGAVDIMRRHESELRDVVAQMGGDSILAEAARDHLRGEVTPLSAAVIATIAADQSWEWWDGIKLYADAWISTRGLTFAAEATAELARVHDHKSPSRTRHNYLRFRQADDTDWGVGTNENIAERIRAFLAVAETGDYQAAVSALANHRTTEFQRTVVSFLVPTEMDWMDENCRGAATVDLPQVQWRLLLSSVGSAKQLATLSTRERDWKWLSRKELLSTLLAALGAEALPAFAKEIEGRWSHIILSGVVAIPTDEAFALLLPRLEQAGVHSRVREAMQCFPVRALRLLASASTGTSEAATYAARLLRSHLLDNPRLVAAVRPSLAPEVQTAIDTVDARTKWVAEAPAAAIPQLLVEPPWIRLRKPPKRVVVKDLIPHATSTVVWAPDERQQWEATRDYQFGPMADVDWSEEIASYQQTGIPDQDASLFFAEAPVELARPLLASEKLPNQWDHQMLKRIVARYELDAVPAAVQVARSNPARHAEKLLPLFTIEIAKLMADWLVRLDSVRPTATNWFHRHSRSAARALVPDALSKAGTQQRAAETALRAIATHVGTADVVEAASGYGDKAKRAVAALLTADPLDFVPARIPDVTDSLDLDLLPQLLLRGRDRALPQTATRHLITMLALSKPGEIYAGVDVLKEQLDPVSLAELGWEMFKWIEHDKWVSESNGWALHALAATGDDDTARKLASVVRAWPGVSRHAKAVAGLDVLASIGTEVALMQLHGIATSVKFKGLKAKAQEKVAQVAAGLGLSAEQLADRLVPDFGLDERGSIGLDYGPRRFVVGFDEQLKPYVADEDGTRRKALPQPGLRDDPDLAPAAYKRFTGLKKDVRAVAETQIRRFEQAMIAQRRWSVPEFRSLFVEHPLLWHVVRRLLWITDEGLTFRLAEDRTLADIDDKTLALPESTVVGIAHPVHFTDTRHTWAEVFDDYQITQPFAQLDRPVHALTGEEKSSTNLKRFQDITVSMFSVLGLERRGWQRPAEKDNGLESWISRPVPGNRMIVIDLDPGITVGMLNYRPEQRLQAIRIGSASDRHRIPQPSMTFAELDAVTASEVLSELTELTR